MPPLPVFITSQNTVIPAREYLWDLEFRPESLLPEDGPRFEEWAEKIASHFGITPLDISRTKMQLITASILGGSYQYNPRRLEERWSGFWQVLSLALANTVTVAWTPFIVQHQFNLWRLNRDEHTLSILEIPAFEAPNSSLLPNEDSFSEAFETSESEALRGEVFLVQNWGVDGYDDGYDDEDEDEDFGDFFDATQGRPPLQARNTLPDSTPHSSIPSTPIVHSSNELAPEAAPSVPQAQRDLDPARLVALQTSEHITQRVSRPQNVRRHVDEGLSHEDPHAEDDVRPMKSQTLSRGTFSCQITDMALLYVQDLGPLDSVRFASLAALEERTACNGWGIKREWVPFIVENKRLPKRGVLYRGGVTDPSAVLPLITKAQEQVLKQAAYFFTSLRWRHQDKLVTIAASGDWWTWAIVTLTDAMKRRREGDSDSAKTEPIDYEPDDSTLGHTEWVYPMRYGTPESCWEMAKLHAWLKAFVENINAPQA